MTIIKKIFVDNEEVALVVDYNKLSDGVSFVSKEEERGVKRAGGRKERQLEPRWAKDVWLQDKVTDSEDMTMTSKAAVRRCDGDELENW